MRERKKPFKCLFNRTAKKLKSRGIWREIQRKEGRNFPPKLTFLISFCNRRANFLSCSSCRSRSSSALCCSISRPKSLWKAGEPSWTSNSEITACGDLQLHVESKPRVALFRLPWIGLRRSEGKALAIRNSFPFGAATTSLFDPECLYVRSALAPEGGEILGSFSSIHSPQLLAGAFGRAGERKTKKQDPNTTQAITRKKIRTSIRLYLHTQDGCDGRQDSVYAFRSGSDPSSQGPRWARTNLAIPFHSIIPRWKLGKR